MSSAFAAQLKSQIDSLAAEGLRCLALAEVPNAGKLSELTAENKGKLLGGISHLDYGSYEEDATFIGLVCIKDPARAEVAPAIADCHTAGIRVIMITGDARHTAVAVARELNILEEHQDEKDSCFTGTEFAAMNENQRKAALGEEGGRVFSRVEPKHKRDLVKCLIDMGHVVAMTGDGVNDAPALK